MLTMVRADASHPPSETRNSNPESPPKMSKPASVVSAFTTTSVRSSKPGAAAPVVVKASPAKEDDKNSKAPSSRASAAGAGGDAANKNSKAPTEVSVAATGTTSVLEKKLTKLTDQLETERTARVKAQEELKRTCAELEALEQVLKLREPAEKKRTGYAGRL